MTDWLVAQPEWVQALVRVVVFVVPILLIVPGLIWWERRLLSWMQDRVGPNRVATFSFSQRFPIPGLRGKKFRTFGLLQPIADGVKLFLKEDLTPASIDRVIYVIAPAVALFPAFALGGTLPWGPNSAWTPIADVEIGVLYVLAVSSLGVYGVVLGGYASNNKYSLLGGLRASAQLISYELAMAMALAATIVATGSLKMTEMVRTQADPLWGVVPWIQNWYILTPFGLIAGLVFLVCVVAETNRAPFDLPEAENEIIAGYHTEYSSMKFAVYFMGEYAAMLIFSGVAVAVFFGGYNALPVNWAEVGASLPYLKGFCNWVAGINESLAPLWFLGKAAVGFTCFIWLRATLPRLRYDQLMNLGWKVLLPVATANFLVAGLWVLATELWGVAGGWLAWAIATGGLVAVYLGVLRAFQPALQAKFEKRTVRLVDPKREQDNLARERVG